LTLARLIELAVGEPGSKEISDELLPPSPNTTSLDDSGLTPRELQVLELLVDGRTNPAIADALFISPRTVSVHVTHILEKLGVENRSAAVAIALRSGIVRPQERASK
jgi:DNA-binding NarL/FixJ family response regulator